MKRLLALLAFFPLSAFAASPSSNTVAELNVTTGLTLNGTRQTSWPSGGLANTVLGPGSATVAGNPVTWADTTGTNINTSATPNGGSFTNLNQSGLLSLNSAYWRAAQANMLLQSNTQWTLFFLGDSWTMASTNAAIGNANTDGFFFRLQNALKAQYGDAGEGWRSAAVFNQLWFNEPTGTMLLYTNGGDGSTWSLNQDYLGNNNTNSTPFLTWTGECKQVVIYLDNHFGGANSGITVKTNGSVFGTAPTTSGFQRYTVTFPVQATTNILEIDYINASFINIYGMDIQKTNAGVRFANYGKSGRQAGDVVSGTALSALQNALTGFAPTVVFCDLGQNDLDNGNIGTLGANLVAIITNIQAKAASSSIFIAARPDVAITNSGNSMLTVEGILRTVCATNNVTYIDAFHSQPRYSQGLGMGLYFNTKHYQTLGYSMYSDLIYRSLMGGPMTMNYKP